MSDFTDTHAAVLTALCDTIVPSVERAKDPDGFFARKASDIGVDQALSQFLASMPDDQRAGLLQLLEALADQGFIRASLRSREQILRNVALTGAEAAAGVGALSTLTLFFYYGLPDERGQNPNWATFGYPGPVSAPPQIEKPLKPLVPEGDTTLEADVCVVGSGAGGSVMAARLAERGLKVVVLEAGGYFDEPDFNQLEMVAYQNAYWRGGPTPTADMNISLQAGSCLGGGTVINWTNALRTKPWVREQWEREFGLEGIAGPEFDRHLDAVWERLGVNDRCSELNGPQTRMKEGAEALGWSFSTVTRNADPERYSFDTAGYMGFGDQSGSKRSTLKTYLQDAAERGAELVTRCWAERIVVENGRAAGVEAVWSDPETGRAAKVVVHAPQVVVAAGALESPALLLRSQIGGPAAGDHLRLHPCTATFGFYPGDQQAWKGAPHAGLVDEFAGADDGYGFLIEGAQYTTAVAGSAVPFTTGAEHKQVMAKFRHGATLIGLVRDHGHGRVTIDHAGMGVPSYSLSDERDLRNTHHAIEVQLKLHEAAGAQQVMALAAGLPIWRWGDDMDAYVARVQRIPLRAGGWKLFSAHQMGSCRMGTDPQTSVAGPWGELHDTAGVWIGDASAFPTPSGTNPMITIMALAHRNAEAVAAAAPATAGATATH
ncbi:MAG: Glucose-methanol-choline (GMC) oxidoreductase:NAD binding site [uncultured Solirubrobacteraceae bacterium]|uniref:long-chain-alcohol oxidase n=1 Tax=uncultured Solirubrobacteraceae bacterium TaxID=1162706 RepID=A0A6J4T3H8_9ACTN|nr:MAG: Glucose-methanol-choline (GMC) oxidoreductase:NAD binding site [uncultured Solirubrobacteraceae bacterium]